MRSGPRRLVAAALTCLVLAAAGSRPARAGEALRVLSLSAAEAAVITAPMPGSPPPVWRTTFGAASLIDANAPKPKVIEADVVLLQDVTNLMQLRRAFPPKSWRLIVSRQMVPDDARSPAAISKNPSTVIAVRFQPDIRIAGQEHLMDMADRKSLSEAAKLTGAPELSSAPLVAATAVRLNIAGKFAWVVSASFDESCGIPGPACPQRTRLNTWIDQRRKMGEAVIAGGLLRESGAAGMDCAAQSVAVYPARDGMLTTVSAATRRDGMGCAALARAGGSR
jgi:hypothetical protein